MTTLDRESKQDDPTSRDSERPLRRSPIFLFILASVLVHGLGMVGFYRLNEPQPIKKTEETPTPIEFVEIPEETKEEPPPETTRRAVNDSVAKSPKKPVTTPKVAPKPQPAPPKPVTPTVSEPPPVLSGTDTNPTSVPKNEPKLETPAPEKSPVATLTPPKTEPPVTTEPKDSAASLLGGNYQRSIEDDGGGSFFESEIVASQTAPYAQLDAQQDRMMSAYFAEIRRRIKRNWSPNSPNDEFNTVLNFSIQRSGQITSLRVTKTSGSQQVDRETLEAVRNSAPFPPFPEEFSLDNLDIEFNFNIYLF